MNIQVEVERLFVSESLKLLESQLCPDKGLMNWSAVITDHWGLPISGGFGQTKSEARSIAVSELLERFTFRQLISNNDESKATWGLDTHPTGCGFAGGYDLEGAISRSLNEAVERWAMSLWIDDHFSIEEIPVHAIERDLDDASLFLASNFDRVRYFKKDVRITIDNQVRTISVGQTMAYKGDGIFPGSSAQQTNGVLWQHALLESFRHLLAIKNNPFREIKFPYDKVLFFSQNSKIADQQIDCRKRDNWPTPMVRLRKFATTFNGQYFIARTIIDGWRSWHLGPVERFLY